MTGPLLMAGGVLLLAAGGTGVLGLLPHPRDGQTEPGHVGWALLAGCALAGLVLHLPLAWNGRIGHAHFLLVLGLCALLAAGPGLSHVKRIGLGPFLGLDHLRELPVWGRILLLGLALLAVTVAAGPLNGWDERAIFALKARVLEHEGSVRGELFTDADAVHSQARYPLLVPLLEASLLVLARTQDDHGLKLLFVAVAFALFLVVASEARRLTGARRGSLWALLLPTTPMLSSPSDGNGMTGYADVTFSAFAVGATVLLGRALERGERAGAALAGLLLGAALATKQEGAVWAAALALALLLVRLRRPPADAMARTVLVAAVPAVAGVALSLLARRFVPEASWSERYGAVFRPEWICALASRPLDLVPFVVGQLTDWKYWGWGWLLVAAGLLFLRRPRPGPAATLWRATALAVFAATVGVFVVTPNHVHWHLATAFARLLLQLFPLAVLVLVEQVAASGWPPQRAGGETAVAAGDRLP